MANQPIQPLIYNAAKRGPDSVKWEFTRLLEDYGGTINFIKSSDKAPNRKASYYNPQVKVKVKVKMATSHRGWQT